MHDIFVSLNKVFTDNIKQTVLVFGSQMTLGSGLADVPVRQIRLIIIFYTYICTACRVSFFGDLCDQPYC